MGEFNFDNFTAASESGLCFSFFILATFFSQIIMLNMLVAIMSDSFERVIQKIEFVAVKTKLELMGELVNIIEDSSEDKDKAVFLFVVKPVEN